MPLEETIALDAEEALRGIDAIESALTSATQSFKVGLAEALDVLSTVSVEEVDASAVTSGIDAAVAAADSTTTVQADTETVTTGIDQAVAAADNTVTIDAITDQVTADIEEAVKAADTSIEIAPAGGGGLDDLSNNANTANQSLTDLAGRAALVNDVLKGAAGDGAAAATSQLGNLGATGLAAGAAVTTVTGIISSFTQEALEAVTATQRFSDVFGPFAGQIEQVDIAGLNISLSDLALNLGADDDALRQSLASFGQLGIAAGRAREEVAGSAEQLVVLASAVAAANPALGTTSDIIDRIGPALARGGRFAAQYGLDLDRATIAARAVSNANGDAAAATDQFALRQAGLQLALEQIPDVAARIDAGFDKPIVKLRAFQQAQREAQEEGGKNFLGPLQAAAQQLEPVLTALIRLVGAGLGVGFRLLLAAIAPVVPLLRLAAVAANGLATAFEFINSVLDRLGGFVIDRLKSTLSGLIDLYNKIPLLPNIDNPFKEAGAAAGAAIGPTEGYAGAVTDVGNAANFAATELANAFDAHVGLIDAQDSLASAQRNVRNAQERINEAVGGGATKTKSAAERALELRQAQLGVVSAQSQLEDSTDAVGEAQQKLADLYVVTEEEAKRIEQAQRSLVDAQKSYKDATDRVTEAQERLRGVTRAATAAEADQARRDVKRAKLSEEDARDRLEDAEKQLAAAQVTAQRSAGRSERVQAAAAEQLSDAQRELAKAQLDVADAAAHSTDIQKDANDKLDGSIGTAEDAKDAQKQLDDAQRAQADAAQQVVDAQKELDTAQQATQVSAKDLHDAQRNLERAELAQQQAVLSLDQANQNLTKAQVGTSESAGGAARNAHALRDAQEALVDAYKALLEPMTLVLDKQDLLADGTLTAKEHAENQITALHELARVVGPDSELGRNLEARAAELQADFDRTYHTQIVVEADLKKLQTALHALDALPGIGAISAQVDDVIARQSNMAGTNDFAGGFTTVGERGAEIVWLPPHSQIVPNNQSQQFADQFGGRPIEVTINEVAGDPDATAFAVGARLGQESQR